MAQLAELKEAEAQSVVTLEELHKRRLQLQHAEAGAQFTTCFTEVQILTAARRSGAEFTPCFTSTKVQILTAARRSRCAMYS